LEKRGVGRFFNNDALLMNSIVFLISSELVLKKAVFLPLV
jgi:hypothetical protein